MAAVVRRRLMTAAEGEENRTVAVGTWNVLLIEMTANYVRRRKSNINVADAVAFSSEVGGRFNEKT